MDKEPGAPDSMNLQFPPTYQAIPEEMISCRESYVNTEQNQLQPRIHEQVDLASLPQTLQVVRNNNCPSGGSSAAAAFHNYDYSAANHCIEPAAFTTRDVAVLPPFESLPVQSEEDRYKPMWSPEEAKRLFAQHFQSLDEFSSFMGPPQAAAAPTVASWRRPASLNPALSSSNAQQRSSRICAPVPRWPQVNSTGQQHSSTLESPTDEAALQMSLPTRLGIQPDMSSMLPGERFAQSEYPSAGKRGEVLHTADHLSHGSMMNSMQHASGHAGALLQLPYDSFLTMDHGDRHQILTASITDQLHEQAASARAAAAHQDLQLQLAIGYSNDRPAVQLDHHGTQNSLQWSQTFPSAPAAAAVQLDHHGIQNNLQWSQTFPTAPAAAAARPPKRNAQDDPVLADHRASSKLKRPWQDPQFSIPAAARPATSSQLFSHSYPAPANTTTFAVPPGNSSMNFRPTWRRVEQAAGAAATTPTKLHTIPEDQVPCNHGWNSELQYKRPAGCQEPLTIDEWLQKSATSSTTPSPGAASLPSSSLQVPAAYPGIIPSAAKRSWNDIPWQQQQQDQLPVILQEQWWVPKATTCTASAATRASTSHEQLSAFPESWNPSAVNYSSNYNPVSYCNTMMTAEELAGAAARTTATKDLAVWRSCTAPAADRSLYNDQSSTNLEQQPIKFMDLLCMDSETDDISTSCEASQYSDDPNAHEFYNCDHDAMSFVGAIQPAAAASTSDHHLLEALLEAAAPGSSAASAVPTSPGNMNIVRGHFSRGVWMKDSPLQMSSKVESGKLHFEITQRAAATPTRSYKQDAAAAAATPDDQDIAEDGRISCFSCRFSKEELLQFLQGKITISSEGAITNIPVPPFVEPTLRSYKSPAPPAVTVFQNWMAEHFHKPYPNDAEKDDLCFRTGISKKKLEKWFNNARHRFWKPLVEGMQNQLQLLILSDKDPNITGITNQHQLQIHYTTPLPPSPSPSPATASAQDEYEDNDDDPATSRHQQQAAAPGYEEEGIDDVSSDGR